jgi:hypothetical protein
METIEPPKNHSPHFVKSYKLYKVLYDIHKEEGKKHKQFLMYNPMKDVFYVGFGHEEFKYHIFYEPATDAHLIPNPEKTYYETIIQNKTIYTTQETIIIKPNGTTKSYKEPKPPSEETTLIKKYVYKKLSIIID